MKHRMVVALSVLSLIVFIGQQTTAQEAEWIKEAPGHPYYAETYHLKGKDCFVNVHADGKGITLAARALIVDSRDPSLTALTVQQVDIRRKGKFKIKPVDRRSSTALETLWDPETRQVFVVRSSYFEDALAPDSFSTCKEEASVLPQKVKVLFLGEYGLGKPLPLKPKSPASEKLSGAFFMHANSGM